MSNLEGMKFLQTEKSKESILDLLKQKGLGTTLKSLGLTLEDVNNPKFMRNLSKNDHKLIEENFAQGDDLITMYRYVAFSTSGYGSSELGANSRKFCKDLVSKSKSKLFTYQDILSISPMKGMGQGGSNIYSVFKFRGGVHCKHVWVKYQYSKKAKKLMQVPASEQPNQIGKGDVPNA